jgi:hypothetical protein
MTRGVPYCLAEASAIATLTFAFNESHSRRKSKRSALGARTAAAGARDSALASLWVVTEKITPPERSLRA